ncbi:MAG: transporter substrate-binding domain-containing protein [Moorea sp. SIO1F2]|uniref:transporter substrate-binding domain-containing protein n=1 Tax=unclassified Moorena TaxID=2683338 RepID=UPI0013B8E1A9|nr:MULTISPECIES: transporter substrate-binding domain-containing protein [unclassified Moorena]NEO06487.1 transporter substrate-binding domain-containing protein [Moorena sp. SIO3I8]NEQ59534.1 transporter substrate-binding domain-containing protein [Moorena sp. SIO4A1]NET82657.1 transporter substrate-binding domain-containing protein [Moorena sp. SIO1F2]
MSNKLATITVSIILSLTFTSASLAETVLSEIKRTGVLKVGIREDAAPFGFLDDQDKLQGYCMTKMYVLANYFGEVLNRPVRLEPIPSVLDEDSPNNRYGMVANGKVHLDCGPNTIKSAPPLSGVTYSTAFYFSGTHFLIRPEMKGIFNPETSLAGKKIGVLPGSNTHPLISSTYPLAEIVDTRYRGSNGRELALRDVVERDIDAFASDGMLLMAEALRQGLTFQDFTLIPDRPLSCDFYGIILPDQDIEWKTIIDKFITNLRWEIILEKSLGVESIYYQGLRQAAYEKCAN